MIREESSYTDGWDDYTFRVEREPDREHAETLCVLSREAKEVATLTYLDAASLKILKRLIEKELDKLESI